MRVGVHPAQGVLVMVAVRASMARAVAVCGFTVGAVAVSVGVSAALGSPSPGVGVRGVEVLPEVRFKVAAVALRCAATEVRTERTPAAAGSGRIATSSRAQIITKPSTARSQYGYRRIKAHTALKDARIFYIIHRSHGLFFMGEYDIFTRNA